MKPFRRVHGNLSRPVLEAPATKRQRIGISEIGPVCCVLSMDCIKITKALRCVHCAQVRKTNCRMFQCQQCFCHLCLKCSEHGNAGVEASGAVQASPNNEHDVDSDEELEVAPADPLELPNLLVDLNFWEVGCLMRSLAKDDGDDASKLRIQRLLVGWLRQS